MFGLLRNIQNKSDSDADDFNKMLKDELEAINIPQTRAEERVNRGTAGRRVTQRVVRDRTLTTDSDGDHHPTTSTHNSRIHTLSNINNANTTTTSNTSHKSSLSSQRKNTHILPVFSDEEKQRELEMKDSIVDFKYDNKALYKFSSITINDYINGTLTTVDDAKRYKQQLQQQQQQNKQYNQGNGNNNGTNNDDNNNKPIIIGQEIHPIDASYLNVLAQPIIIPSSSSSSSLHNDKQHDDKSSSSTTTTPFVSSISLSSALYKQQYGQQQQHRMVSPPRLTPNPRLCQLVHKLRLRTNKVYYQHFSKKIMAQRTHEHQTKIQQYEHDNTIYQDQMLSILQYRMDNINKRYIALDELEKEHNANIQHIKIQSNMDNINNITDTTILKYIHDEHDLYMRHKLCIVYGNDGPYADPSCPIDQYQDPVLPSLDIAKAQCYKQFIKEQQQYEQYQLQLQNNTDNDNQQQLQQQPSDMAHIIKPVIPAIDKVVKTALPLDSSIDWDHVNEKQQCLYCYCRPLHLFNTKKVAVSPSTSMTPSSESSLTTTPQIKQLTPIRYTTEDGKLYWELLTAQQHRLVSRGGHFITMLERVIISVKYNIPLRLHSTVIDNIKSILSSSSLSSSITEQQYYGIINTNKHIIPSSSLDYIDILPSWFKVSPLLYTQQQHPHVEMISASSASSSSLSIPLITTMDTSRGVVIYLKDTFALDVLYALLTFHACYPLGVYHIKDIISFSSTSQSTSTSSSSSTSSSISSLSSVGNLYNIFITGNNTNEYNDLVSAGYKYKIPIIFNIGTCTCHDTTSMDILNTICKQQCNNSDDKIQQEGKQQQPEEGTTSTAATATPEQHQQDQQHTLSSIIDPGCGYPLAMLTYALPHTKCIHDLSSQYFKHSTNNHGDDDDDDDDDQVVVLKSYK